MFPPTAGVREFALMFAFGNVLTVFLRVSSLSFQPFDCHRVHKQGFEVIVGSRPRQATRPGGALYAMIFSLQLHCRSTNPITRTFYSIAFNGVISNTSGRCTQTTSEGAFFVRDTRIRAIVHSTGNEMKASRHLWRGTTTSHDVKN